MISPTATDALRFFYNIKYHNKIDGMIIIVGIPRNLTEYLKLLDAVEASCTGH